MGGSAMRIAGVNFRQLPISHTTAGIHQCMGNQRIELSLRIDAARDYVGKLRGQTLSMTEAISEATSLVKIGTGTAALVNNDEEGRTPFNKRREFIGQLLDCLEIVTSNIQPAPDEIDDKTKEALATLQAEIGNFINTAGPIFLKPIPVDCLDLPAGSSDVFSRLGVNWSGVRPSIDPNRGDREKLWHILSSQPVHDNLPLEHPIIIYRAIFAPLEDTFGTAQSLPLLMPRADSDGLLMPAGLGNRPNLAATQKYHPDLIPPSRISIASTALVAGILVGIMIFSETETFSPLHVALSRYEGFMNVLGGLMQSTLGFASMLLFGSSFTGAFLVYVKVASLFFKRQKVNNNPIVQRAKLDDKRSSPDGWRKALAAAMPSQTQAHVYAPNTSARIEPPHLRIVDETGVAGAEMEALEVTDAAEAEKKQRQT